MDARPQASNRIDWGVHEDVPVRTPTDPQTWADGVLLGVRSGVERPRLSYSSQCHVSGEGSGTLKTVYLAGLISTDCPQSLQWRIDAAERLKSAGVRVLSPMRGKIFLHQSSPDGGLTDPHLTPRDITLRDFCDVRKADAVLMHLETFGSSRPLIGTICELAWCWEHRVPLVGIASAGNYLMRKHPFVADAVSHYVETVNDGVDFIVTHYCVEE